MGILTSNHKFSIIILLLFLSIQNVNSAPIDNLHTRITDINYSSYLDENRTVFTISINSEILNNSSRSVTINFGSNCEFGLLVIINDSKIPKGIDSRICNDESIPIEFQSGLTNLDVPGYFLVDGNLTNLIGKYYFYLSLRGESNFSQYYGVTLISNSTHEELIYDKVPESWGTVSSVPINSSGILIAFSVIVLYQVKIKRN